MNDVRDRTKISSLPDDLKAVADKMLEEKFDLPVKGEVKKKDWRFPDVSQGAVDISHWQGTTTYTIPDGEAILNHIYKLYRQCLNENPYRPEEIMMHDLCAEALKNLNIREPKLMGAVKYDWNYRSLNAFGMRVKTDRRIEVNRFILTCDDGMRIMLDSRIHV